MTAIDDTSAGPRLYQIPDGDDRERLTCPDCGYIAYENPRIVVGSVVRADDERILLCRRAIAPRIGYWTMPAGYLELNETAEEGAMREAWEEACTRLQLTGLLAVYSLARIHQVQLIYRAVMTDPSFAAGPESQEVALFHYDEIPWDELAFPTVEWALKQDHQVHMQGHGQAFANPIEEA
jgi:ADP-ribose pyrophosphatase YjhB (NUDIX family)